jgi:hypothetical protein
MERLGLARKAVKQGQEKPFKRGESRDSRLGRLLKDAQELGDVVRK